MRAVHAGVTLVLAQLPLASLGQAGGPQSGVASTVHNLSVSGPGEIKGVEETEICRFCHVPHDARPATPLWGHALSSQQEYVLPTLRRPGGTSERPPQPDGSSRLCLSCHDGTVALGAVRHAGTELPMAGARRLEKGRRGHLGSDLSGSHPISLAVPDLGTAAEAGRDMSVKPLTVIRAAGQARLDAAGKVQCTSCHDPHADSHYQPGRVPRFWIRPTVDEVCLGCHELR